MKTPTNDEKINKMARYPYWLFNQIYTTHCLACNEKVVSHSPCKKYCTPCSDIVRHKQVLKTVVRNLNTPWSDIDSYRQQCLKTEGRLYENTN